MSIDIENIKIGSLVEVKPKDGAVLFDESKETNIAKIIEIRENSTYYKYRADFKITKDVLIYVEEIYKILTKETNPEYFL